MVSITKLYFFFAKETFVCIRVTHRKSEELLHNIRYNRGNTHGFHKFYALFFTRKQTSILTLQLSVLLPCIRQQIKGEQSDEIRHSSLINSKPHEVKSTNMHCILTTNINKCRGEKTTRRKGCQIFTSAPARRRWTQSGTNIVIFLEAFCAQTNLFWCEMNLKKMYTET